MWHLLFPALPEGNVETQSIFLSIAALGSFLMALGLLRCLLRAAEAGGTPRLPLRRVSGRRWRCIDPAFVMGMLQAPDSAGGSEIYAV